jgi:hypothetical protein
MRAKATYRAARRNTARIVKAQAKTSGDRVTWREAWAHVQAAGRANNARPRQRQS